MALLPLRLLLTASLVLPLVGCTRAGGSGDAEPGIYVVGTDGSALTLLAAGAWGAAWSPDGRKLLFAAGDEGGAEIAVVSADGSDGARVVEVQSINGPPAWAPDGEWIAFVDDDELFVVGIDGAVLASVSLPYTSPDPSDPERPSHSLAWQEPVWSPAGQRIAVDYAGAVHAVDADGSGQPRLLASGGSSLAWSPDGAKIAFRDSGVVVANGDGSGRVRLTGVEVTSGPAWSPDGRKLLFGSWRGALADIYVVGVDGGEATNLTRNVAAQADAPVWSPDGAAIAFTADGDIWVMNADGSGQRRVIDSGLDDLEPAWSPDGTRIAFLGQPFYEGD